MIIRSNNRTIFSRILTVHTKKFETCECIIVELFEYTHMYSMYCNHCLCSTNVDVKNSSITHLLVYRSMCSSKDGF